MNEGMVAIQVDDFPVGWPPIAIAAQAVIVPYTLLEPEDWRRP